MMISKTTMCLIVITTTCQTALQFARGDDYCDCYQNTDHSCIMKATGEIIGFNHPPFKADRSIILYLKTWKKHSAGTDKKCEYSNSEIVFEYSNGIRIFEHSLTCFVKSESGLFRP